MMVVRGERLDRTMLASLVERIERHSLSDVRLHSQVTELHSDSDQLAAVAVSDAAGATERRGADALFICIGGDRAQAGRPRPGFAPTAPATSSPASTC